MMTKDELANFLVKIANIYNNHRYNAIDSRLQDAAIEEIHSYKVLSARAIAAIVGCGEARVVAVLGRDASRARGKLNPQHISWLAYALSLHKITPDNLRMMLNGGTSISTIQSLTGISRATLNRWRKM